MVDRVKKLTSALDSLAVVFAAFTRIKQMPKRLIAIVEGYDEPYYGIRFKNTIQDTKFLPAKGKKRVLELREFILKHDDYKDSNVVYIIDADFDDNCSYIADDTYITPFYSVENFYFDDVVITDILSAEFHLSEHESPEEFEKVVKWIEKSKRDYLTIIKDYNYFVKAQRIMEEDKCGEVRLNLKNVEDKKIYTISNNGITKNEDLILIDLFGDALPISNEVILQVESFFLDKQPEHCYRGKQHAYFLVKLFELLKRDRNSESPQIFVSKSKVSLQFSQDTLISSFSQYAVTPQCLKQFINKQVSRFGMIITS